MKIYKIVLVGAIALSTYLGYSNFIKIDLAEITEIFTPASMEKTEEMVRERARAPEAARALEKEPDDYVDLVIKIGETLAPLLMPYLASRKRKDKKGVVKTLDEDLRDVAEHLGVSKAFVRGRLGIGDMRKKQNGTTNRRRIDDRKKV